MINMFDFKLHCLSKKEQQQNFDYKKHPNISSGSTIFQLMYNVVPKK